MTLPPRLSRLRPPEHSPCRCSARLCALANLTSFYRGAIRLRDGPAATAARRATRSHEDGKEKLAVVERYGVERVIGDRGNVAGQLGFALPATSGRAPVP